MIQRQLTPFVVDPEELARIRPMEPRDLDDVARLHKAMGRSLWGELGAEFLKEVYGAVLGHPDFLGFVYEFNGRVRGFIAGTSDGPRMSKDTLLRHGRRLVRATLRGLLRHPGASLDMLETLLYFHKSAPEGPEKVHAESMFCSFDPELRGKRVSGLINKVLFDALSSRGQTYVKITTEAANRLAARQLTSWGFEALRRFNFYGKEMILWRLDLRYCPRVEAAASVKTIRDEAEHVG